MVRQVLGAVVLDRLGGSNGVHGTFIETDEREELVLDLLDVVAAPGLDSGREDLTGSYRD